MVTIQDVTPSTYSLMVGRARRESTEAGTQWAQPHPVPHPPPERGATDGVGAPAEAPTDANTDKRRTAPSCPAGHVAGSLAADMVRRSSKVASQVLQRNS